MSSIFAFFEKYLNLIIGLIIGIAVGCAFGYIYRWSGDSDRQAKAEIKQVEKANSAAQELEIKKNERQIEYKTITKTVDRIIDRPIYRNECIDADGLRSINDALSGSRKPSSAMPTVIASK